MRLFGPIVQHTPGLTELENFRGSSASAAPGAHTLNNPRPPLVRNISYFEGCTCLSVTSPGGSVTTEQLVTRKLIVLQIVFDELASFLVVHTAREVSRSASAALEL